MSLSPPSSLSPTYCIDPICPPVSKVSEASIAQSHNIKTTIVSTLTTPELEPSLSPWPLHTLSLVSAANDVDEGQLPNPNEYASDSGVSGVGSDVDDDDDDDDDNSLLASYLVPKWHGSIPHASISDYPFPCSEMELQVYEPWRYRLISRLRKHHGMSPLHLAPIDTHPQKIVDIGTGTGLWANDIADVYPSAAVEGTDINAIVLSEYTATNVKFIQDDVEKTWTFMDNSLDFVHASLILNCIKYRLQLFHEILRCLKPGAWVEWVDFHYLPHTEDGSIVNNGNFEFHKTLATAMAKHNFNLQAITSATGELESAGFINVQEKVLKMPIGGWNEDPELKEIGEAFGVVMKEAISEIGMREIQESLGWSWEQVTVLGGKAKESLDLLLRTYFPLHIVIGQKPA